MTLQFSVLVSSFGIGATQNLQVWATTTGDCTAPTTRGIGTTADTCWLVNEGLADLVETSTQAYQFNVRVQDLVGPQNAPPQGSSLVHENATACIQQASFAAVPIDIWFLPLDTSGNYVGTGFNYSLTADLVGPPAPAAVSIGDADGLLAVHWTPNVDTDTAGYDVFIDPPPGSRPIVDGGSNAYGGDGASTNAVGACMGIGLPTGTLAGEGGVAPAVEGGTVVSIDAGDQVISGAGGISTIPCRYLVGTTCAAGSPAYTNFGNPTVTGESSGSYAIRGLTDGVPYDVVVAAVDGSGNVGPASIGVCDSPGPAKSYPQAACALEAVGKPAGLPADGLAFAVIRRLPVGIVQRR